MLGEIQLDCQVAQLVLAFGIALTVVAFGEGLEIRLLVREEDDAEGRSPPGSEAVV